MTLTELMAYAIANNITLRDAILYQTYLQSPEGGQYEIKNAIIYLTDTTANGDPLENPTVGFPLDNAIFVSIENTSATQNVIYDDTNTIEAGDPVITFPNAGNVEHRPMTIKCETGATATIIYQYKQIL